MSHADWFQLISAITAAVFGFFGARYGAKKGSE